MPIPATGHTATACCTKVSGSWDSRSSRRKATTLHRPGIRPVHGPVVGAGVGLGSGSGSALGIDPIVGPPPPPGPADASGDPGATDGDGPSASRPVGSDPAQGCQARRPSRARRAAPARTGRRPLPRSTGWSGVVAPGSVIGWSPGPPAIALGQRTGRRLSSTIWSAVTGFGTSPSGSFERKSIEVVQPARSIAPRPCVSVRVVVPGVDRRLEDRHLGGPVGGQLGDRHDRRVEALLRVGDDLVHRPEGRRDEQGDRVALRLERLRPGDQPVSGERHDVVDVEDRRVDARSPS